MSRKAPIVIVASVLTIAVAGAVVFGALRDDPKTEAQGPSREEVTMADSLCFNDAIEADRYEPGTHDETYATCLDDRLGMTVTEVDDIVSPISELPACDALWTEGVQWDSSEDTYGWECRYGSGAGKRYEADATACFARNKVDGWLVVGPDDLYIFRGGTDGWDATVDDGSTYSEYAGQTGVEIAREVCSGI